MRTRDDAPDAARRAQRACAAPAVPRALRCYAFKDAAFTARRLRADARASHDAAARESAAGSATRCLLRVRAASRVSGAPLNAGDHVSFSFVARCRCFNTPHVYVVCRMLA